VLSSDSAIVLDCIGTGDSEVDTRCLVRVFRTKIAALNSKSAASRGTEKRRIQASTGNPTWGCAADYDSALDHAADKQDDHHESEGVSIINKDRRRVAAEVAQQEPDRGVAGDERNDDRNDDRRPSDLREMRALVKQFEDSGTADRGNAQEK